MLTPNASRNGEHAHGARRYDRAVSEKPSEKRDLTDEQNEAFRELLRAVLRAGAKQTMLSEHIGGDQSGWSKFLSSRQGTSAPRARALAKYARTWLKPEDHGVIEAALDTLPREETGGEGRAPNYDRAAAIAQQMLDIGEIDEHELAAVEKQIVVELGFASSGTFTPGQEAEAGRAARARVRGRAEAFRADVGVPVSPASTLAVVRPGGKLVRRSGGKR